LDPPPTPPSPPAPPAPPAPPLAPPPIAGGMGVPLPGTEGQEQKPLHWVESDPTQGRSQRTHNTDNRSIGERHARRVPFPSVDVYVRRSAVCDVFRINPSKKGTVPFFLDVFRFRSP
jgi:hypothetical protein